MPIIDKYEDLDEFLRDSSLNNSYDEKTVKKVLNETWVSSYSYLHNKQLSDVDYTQLTYISNDTTCRDKKTIGTLYLDHSIRANFDIDYDLIGVYDRKEYRTSRYYKKPITPKDIAYNSNIFGKMPIVIIDNQVIWDYEMYITKDNTRFRLPFKRNFVLYDERKENGDYTYKTHIIQIMLVETGFYQRIETYRSGLNLAEYNDPITGEKYYTIGISNDIITSKNTESIAKETKSELIEDLNLDGSYDDQPSDVKAFIDKSISNRIKINNYKKFNDKGTMFCSLHFCDQYDEKYELGSTLIPLDIHDSVSFKGSITSDLVTRINNSNNKIFISLVFIPELYQHKFYDGRNYTTLANNNPKYFVLSEFDEDGNEVPYSMPIPIENLVVFQKIDSSDSYQLVQNTDNVSLHYPNIYEITTTTPKTTRIFYFYHRNDDITYTILFDFYFNYITKNVIKAGLEKTINDIYYGSTGDKTFTDSQRTEFNNIFNKILNYKYYEYNYGDSDFIYNYLGLPCADDYINEPDQYERPIQYDDTRMREWVSKDPETLRKYVLEQNKLGDSYYLYTNTIDLESRRRTSAEPEMGMPCDKFPEDRYVFAFNNLKMYPILLDARIFVDGILIGDVYHDRCYFIDYFYIPCDLVTEDSFIEIEIFPAYMYEDTFNFSSLDDKKEVIMLAPDDDIFPTVADLYYSAVDPSNPFPHRYATNLFNITGTFKRGSYEVKTHEEDRPVKYTRIQRFTIQPNDPLVLNQDIRVCCNKRPQMLRFAMERDGYPYIGFVEMNFNFKKEYLRIYRNGRLLPRIHYLFIYTYDNPRLIFLEEFKVGDIIYIDVTPYQYNEIYYAAEVDTSELLIDLSDKINKPFDIRYYDVYMNGRKLSSNNVISITPWEIKLVNLKSKYNLVIYEKERDYEFYGLDYNSDRFYFNLDDLFNSGLLSDEEKNKIVDDIIEKEKDPHLNIKPNTNDEPAMDWSEPDYWRAECYIYYYDELLPKQYMNPDRIQTSSYIMEDVFPDILDIYKVDPVPGHTDILCLNPDLPTPDPEFVPESQFHVLPIGHLGEDLDDEILKERIEINNIGNLN